MRSGKGPALIELVTYRWYGHVDWRDDVDVGVKRSLEDIGNWKARDPIARLSQSMIQAGIWSQSQESELNQKLDNEIEEAWGRAIEDPYPSLEVIQGYVYS